VTTPGTLTVTSIDQITDIDQSEWDRLAGSASLYSAYAWLAFVETYGDCTPCYRLVHQNGTVVAALPSYRFGGPIPRFYDPDFLLPEVSAGRPVLVGGTRQGYATEFLLAPGLDEVGRGAARRALLDALRAESAALRVLLYLPTDELLAVRSLLSDEDRIFLLDARARLTVPPGGRAGYRAMVSDNARNRMRKEMRRFADAGCRAEVRRLSECHSHLGELSAQVLRRYGHPITAEEEAARFAAQASSPLNDLCYVILARQGDRVVGFTQFFVWGGVLYGRLHGLDDTIARSAALYYNLTYYQAVDLAAELGCTAIDLGCDSYEAKVRRGARLELLWGVALEPGWAPSTVSAIAEAGRRRLAEFAAWDPAVATPTVHNLLDQGTTS